MRVDFMPVCTPRTKHGGPRRLSLAAAAVLVIAVIGCSQDMPTQRTRQKPDLTGAVGAASKGDILAQPRFALDVKVSGQLVPGQPITIEATTRAVFPAAAVQLRIATPEIDAARSSGWGSDFQVPVEQEPPAENQTEIALSRGASHTQSATVEVAAPGYYRVVASASAVRKDREFANGQDIQDLVVKELWLLVTPQGGRITETFDPSVFPDSVLRQPGPFRSASAVAPAESGRIRTQSIGTRT